ncbi:reverse transcriptase domain-containing protein [Tanacetum coccineum]
MFLGYKVNTKEIKVCPDKVDIVLSLPSPKYLKDVQKLNGKLASLNRFLAKSAEKSLPFFKTLKKYTKKSDFHRTEEAESVFKQMKQLIAKLPTLTAPEEKEELIVYLEAAKEAISVVLMTEREAKQMPIYLVSHTLRVLSRPEVAGRLQKWSTELGEYAIHYRPRVSVKGQILAEFIVERLEEDSSDTHMEFEEELSEPWILFTDKSSCADGLQIAEEIGVKNLQENVDSRLVAKQVNETYIAKEADMIRYLEKVRAINELELKKKSINELEILAVVEEEGDRWLTPI